MKSPSKAKPPASQPRRIWRLLEKGEALMKGDEWWFAFEMKWLKVNKVCFGTIAGFLPYRRRILVCGYREIRK